MTNPNTLFKSDADTDVRHRPSFAALAVPGKLSLGLMFPIEAFKGDTPTMRDQLAIASNAEALGFASLGFRDVPLRDPGFGDVGQVFDPWVYLGYIAAHTERITLLTTSIVLPIRHSLHTAKAAASVDQLSNGRLVLGIASGDRPIEFAAFGLDKEARGEQLRAQVAAIRDHWGDAGLRLADGYGNTVTAQLVPKPHTAAIPLLVTGYSQSELPWIAEHADGWLMYPRAPGNQAAVIRSWRQALEVSAQGRFKPFMQALYIDLADDPHAPPVPIHLGFRLGRLALLDLLDKLRGIGVNHVVLNLKYATRPAAGMVQEIGEFVIPQLQRTGAHR